MLDDTARTRNRSNPGGPGDGTAMHAEASAYPTSSSNNVTSKRRRANGQVETRENALLPFDFSCCTALTLTVHVRRNACSK